MDFKPLENELVGILFEEDTVFSIIEKYSTNK